MSAIPNYQFPGTEQRKWLTAAQLAAATGSKVRTIQWACKNGDLKHCHRFASNPKGGPDILQIDLVHAPEKYRLAYARRDANECGEAHSLTDRQLKVAAAKAQLIEAVDGYVREQRVLRPAAKERELIAAFLASRRISDPTIPSVATYYRDKQKWLQGGRRLSAIADQRAIAGGGVKAEMDEDAFAFFCSLYLTQSQVKATIAHELTKAKAAEEGWAYPSLATVKRTLNERVSPAKQIELREGPKARQDKADAYIPRDWLTLAGNEFWVSDHCELDLVGVDDLPGGDGQPCRMWMTSWMDERSRYCIIARVHRGPTAREVMASFHDAILAEGIPQNIRIDNGKDYRCQRFAGGRAWRTEISKIQVDETKVRPILYDLGIVPHYAKPYNARAKIVEPWHHHFVKEWFSKLFPSFCGGNTQEKPEQLADVIKHWKKTGEGLLPWSQLINLLQEAITAYNMRGKDGLDGKSPAFVYQQTVAERRRPDARTARKLLQDERVITIGRMGIEYMGAVYGIGNPDVASRQGEKVIIRADHMNVGRVYVFDLKDLYITTAENAGRLAANAQAEDIQKWHRLVKKHNKMVDEVGRNMPIMTAVDPVEAIALSKKATRGAEPPPPVEVPPILKPLNWGDNDQPLAFRQVSPAPDGSKVVREQVEAGTDSPAEVAARLLPENILDVFAAG